MTENKQRRLLLFGLTAGLTAGLLVLLLYDPAGSRLFPPCLFHKLTGLYCPGCGSLRALHRLLNGRPLQAFGCNPLMIAALPFVAYGLTAVGLRYFFSLKIPILTLKSRTIWAILAIIILYAIIRNIPAYPFTFLAPPS